MRGAQGQALFIAIAFAAIIFVEIHSGAIAVKNHFLSVENDPVLFWFLIGLQTLLGLLALLKAFGREIARINTRWLGLILLAMVLVAIAIELTDHVTNR